CRSAVSSAASRCRRGVTPTCAALRSPPASSSACKRPELHRQPERRLISQRPLLRAADAERGSAGSIELPPDALIILPVRNFVLFPGTVFPVTIARPRSLRGAQQAVREQRQIGILM